LLLCIMAGNPAPPVGNLNFTYCTIFLIKHGDLEGTRTLDLRRDRAAF
jgi:hypothetical protein